MPETTDTALPTGVNKRYYDTGSGMELEVNPHTSSGAELFTATTPGAVSFGALAPATDAVAIGPSTSTGATWYEFRSTTTFAKQSVKAAPGTLYSLTVFNNSGATAYVAIFDATTANTTPGTTQMVMEEPVAAAGVVTFTLPTTGLAFTSALTVFSATAENGTTGSASGIVVMATYV